MIRVFIGTEPSQKLPTAVLKHSILSRSTEPVEFIELTETQSKHPGTVKFVGMTGFSLCRFSVPQLCGFDGKAIYMDADIVVLANIAELWHMQPFKPVLAKQYTALDYFTSVMLMDCAQLTHWDFKEWALRSAEDVQFANRLIWARPLAPNHNDFGPLPSQWNDLDILKPATRALHFTQLPKQPWRHSGHSFGYVFRAAMTAAMTAGSITMNFIREQIDAGHVRADLLEVL